MERKEKERRRPKLDKKRKFPYRPDMAFQHIYPNITYAALSFVHPCCKITFLSAYHFHCLRVSLVLREPAYVASVRLITKQ